MHIPTRILVPTDFSEYSDRALEQALDLAKQCNAKVFLLHVVHHPMIHTAELENVLSAETMQQINDKTLAWAQGRLQSQLDSFPRAREIEVVTGIRQGIPYEEILKEGKEKGIDLIVIGSLGRSDIAKYFIGSVTRNVVKSAKCSVLLTK